ncbi:MAG: LPS export ABC transporter ATP-binding protein [Desulfosudaceae bacterium]
MTSLSLRDLTKQYHGRQVVNSVSLELQNNEVVGLLGPNGAGKTTTFYMAVGIIKADSGSVYFHDEEITDLPMHQRARRGIGYLPQEPSIFRKLTVADNIRVVLECLNLPKDQQRERTNRLLEEFNIAHLARQQASVLSGGERRRLEISRVLATSPSFILLDEPFAGIDPLAIADLRNIINQLKNKNIGLIISDHNVRETLQVCDHAYILSDGQVVEHGSPSKIANSPTARRIYLGDEFRL